MKPSYHSYENIDESYIKFLKKRVNTLKNDKYKDCKKQLKSLIIIHQLNAKLQKANNRFTKRYCAYCIGETENFIKTFKTSREMRKVVSMLRKLIKNCENTIGASTVIEMEEKHA